MILQHLNNIFIFFSEKNFNDFNFWKMRISTYKKRNWASMCLNVRELFSKWVFHFLLIILWRCRILGVRDFLETSNIPNLILNFSFCFCHTFGITELKTWKFVYLSCWPIDVFDTLGRILERMRKNMSFVPFIAI